tara:strand:- start:224 stop:391 length:168 start_codon:yes stop_codon:yes gene_type:complete
MMKFLKIGLLVIGVLSMGTLLSLPYLYNTVLLGGFFYTLDARDSAFVPKASLAPL